MDGVALCQCCNLMNRPSKTKTLQEFVARYRREVDDQPVELTVVAKWSIKLGLWQPPYKSPEEILAGELGQALREEYIEDPQGRRVRRKHPRREEELLSDGTTRQRVLWDDITTAQPEHMQISFQQRRRLILADCVQMKSDVDSYNENWNTGRQLEFSYGFEEDMEEMEQPTEYPTEYPVGAPETA